MAEAANTISTVNFCRKRGDTYTFDVLVKDSDGAAIDITGFTFLFTIDPSQTPTDDTNNLAQLTGAIVAPATDGRVRFTPDTDSVGTVGDFFYDLQQTDAGGKIRTLMVGAWVIEQDITK